MTAEIAILNRNAVALAADSAVTLQLPEGPKIYQSNKLFTLSKYRPVGLMIYGSADLMGVPWETIVKQYRSQLQRGSFATLPEYGKNFLTFIERNSIFFPPDQQEEHCINQVLAWLHRLTIRLSRAVKEELKTKKPITATRVKKIFQEIMSEDISHLKNTGLFRDSHR
jgi:hypothetical protein